MANRPLTFITGATSGIGRAAARSFAEKGYHLAITGRRNDRLSELKVELESLYNVQVYPLCFDVRDKNAVYQNLDSIPNEWKKIDVLINNAGLARGLAPIDQGEIEDWEEMIDANVKGLLYVSKIISRWMREAGRGHIINVGSTAAKEVYPNGAVYCATKHAVDAITKGMRMDLLGSGVRVGAIHPGLVETEFSEVRFHGDKARAKKVYEGMQPLTPQDVADAILYMASAPPHVNVADLVLMPTDQASSLLVNRKPTVS